MIYNFNDKEKEIEIKGLNFGHIIQKHNPLTMKKFKNEEDALKWANSNFNNLQILKIKDNNIISTLDENVDNTEIEILIFDEKGNVIKKVELKTLTELNIDEIKKDLEKGKYYFDININDNKILLDKKETTFMID